MPNYKPAYNREHERVEQLEAENARLRLIEMAARAYDEFILRHGTLEIERSQRLSVAGHLLHKALHEALSR